MNPTKHLNGTCSECGGPLRFPAAQIGQMDRCPHCGQQTELTLAVPPEEPSASRKMLVWSIVALVVLAVGVIVPVAGLKHFQNRLAVRQKAKAPAHGLDETTAIAAARQAVSTNDTWGNHATFEAHRNGTGWSVTVWREPRTPGGFRTVQIDDQGKVTDYIRGR